MFPANLTGRVGLLFWFSFFLKLPFIFLIPDFFSVYFSFSD